MLSSSHYLSISVTNSVSRLSATRGPDYSELRAESLMSRNAICTRPLVSFVSSQPSVQFIAFLLRYVAENMSFQYALTASFSILTYLSHLILFLSQ